MKLDDKRRVIEVLLCCGHQETPNVYGVGKSLFDHCIAIAACEHRSETLVRVESFSDLTLRYHFTCVEAAYRLIESSPTLRREWFGAP